MKNTLILLAVALTLAAFAGMMRVKTDVQTMDRERLRLVNHRAELRETKRVLEAEWALLASPERLAKLVQERGYVAAAPTNVVPMDEPKATTSKAVSLSSVISQTIAPAAPAPSVPAMVVTHPEL